MYRATTPTHYFKLPSDVSEYSDIHITYTQRGEIILEKNKEDLTLSGNTVYYDLTQDETKLFRPGTVNVQIRVRTTGGKVIASNIICFDAKNVLCDDNLPLEEEDEI